MAVTRNPFNARLSWKWLVAIGILATAIILVIGIILGVIAVHFSNATTHPTTPSGSEEDGRATNALQWQPTSSASQPNMTISQTPSPIHENSSSVADEPTTITTSHPVDQHYLEHVSTHGITELTHLQSITQDVPVASEEDEALSSQPIISTLPPQTEKEKVTLIPTSDGEESRVKPINETSSFGNQLWNASVNGSEFPTMSDRPVWLYANGSSVQLNSTYTTILPNTSQLDNVSTSTWQKPLEIEYTTAVATTDTTNPSITSPLPGDSSGTTSITTQSTEVPTEDDHSTHTPITETFTIGEKETVSSQPSVTESTTPEEAIGIQELKLSTEVGNSSIATSASSNSDIPEKSSTIQATTHQSYSNAEAPLQQTEMNSTTQGAVLSELHVSTDQSSQLSSQVSNSPGESEDSQWNISSTIEHDGSSVEPNRLSSDEESIDLDASEPDFPCPETPNVKIYPGQLCNGEVDCPRATDERNCTCEKRIHRSRICDGVIDCPSMQDEIGCRGCNETQFTCEIRRQRSLCLPLKQRCDGVEQCPDGIDEAGCSLLAPIEHREEALVPKYSSGFVFRNIQNKWYPLCAPPTEIDVSVLAYSICRLTVGEVIGKALVSSVDVLSTNYSGKFASAYAVRDRPFKVTENCTTSKVLAITCPPPQCGQKAPSIQQAEKTAFFSMKLAKTSEIRFNWEMDASRELEAAGNRLTTIHKLNKRRKREAFNRIVGGVFSLQGSWPSMVALLKDGNFTCGGTLVNQSWVLSAAHCFESLHKHHYEAQLGMLRTTSFSPFEQTRIIRNVHIHPGYNRISLEDDIALLEVDRPFDLSQWAAPSCLSATQFSLGNTTQCIVVGWGDTFEGGSESEELREVIIPLTRCTVETTVKPSKVLCAGYPDGQKDACQGDSGGPLMCSDPEAPDRWTLAGVVSSGIGCARPGLAGVYTRLSHYLGWINETIENPVEPTRKPRHDCPGITCRKGAGQCLDKRFRCDSKIQCYDAEDELECHSNLTTESPLPTTMSTEITIATALSTVPSFTIRPPVSSKCSESEFLCSSDFQCVDVSRRCNFVKDCTDGTDELNCTCADYLVGLGKKELICDDHVDCKDSSDELGCRVCPEGEYFSFVSSECIPVRKMCDGRPDASQGDDEFGCVALSSPDNRLELDYKAKPKFSRNGTVFENYRGRWQPLCSFSSLNIETSNICKEMGFQKTLSIQLAGGVDEQSRPLLLETPSGGFLWKSQVSPWVSAKVAAPTCQTVNVACENYQCGTRPAFTTSGSMEGNAPWHVTLFANGNYLCGGTLVHEQWLLTAVGCLQHIDFTRDYVAALMGSRRFLPVESPGEQVRRISGFATMPSNENLLLLRLDEPVFVNQLVNPICMTKNVRHLLRKNMCLTVGLNGTLLTSSASVSSVKMDTLRSVSLLWNNNETFTCPKEKLFGGLACSDGQQWYLVALSEKNCSKKGSFSDNLPGVWREADMISEIIACDGKSSIPNSRRKTRSSCSDLAPVPDVAEPSCSTLRCPLGACLSSHQICDGVADCRDHSDEKHCCSPDQYRCSTGECIATTQLCDGVIDCPDDADEANPRASFTCPKNVFRCLLPRQERSNETVPFEKVCNGIVECSNGADEQKCIALSRDLPIKTDRNGNPKDFPPEGFMMARVSGAWHSYCEASWDINQTRAACNYFGFNSTASFKKEFLHTNASCNFRLYVTCS